MTSFFSLLWSLILLPFPQLPCLTMTFGVLEKGHDLPVSGLGPVSEDTQLIDPLSCPLVSGHRPHPPVPWKAGLV